jgi:DNA repair protein RecO (recombination protein O)
MPLLKTPAIALNSRKWGEADRIVTFYTLKYGRLRGVARGARRPKSRFGSALEPFVHSDLNLFEKPHDALHRITQADICDSFLPIRDDLVRIAGASRLANVVSALTADGDSSPRIFYALLEGLRALADGHDPRLTTTVFQIKLLGLTGFRPQVDHCVTCNDALDMTASGGSAFRFAPLAGGLLCDLCAPSNVERSMRFSRGSGAFLRQALRLAHPVLTRLKASGSVLRDVEQAMEAYVTVVAGKPLPPVDFLAAESEPAYGRSR